MVANRDVRVYSLRGVAVACDRKSGKRSRIGKSTGASDRHDVYVTMISLGGSYVAYTAVGGNAQQMYPRRLNASTGSRTNYNDQMGCAIAGQREDTVLNKLLIGSDGGMAWICYNRTKIEYRATDGTDVRIIAESALPADGASLMEQDGNRVNWTLGPASGSFELGRA